MKRFYPLKLVSIIILVAGISFAANAQTIIYNQSFIGGGTPTTQCTAWTTFCNSLLGSYIYTGFNVSGSLNTTGYTCTNGAVATAIANALRTNSGTTQSSDGHTWYVSAVGACGSGCGSPGGEFAVDQGLCQCGSVCSVRPGINNNNWGGMGTTCSAPSQTLIVTFFYQSITYTGGSPRTLPTVCQNSGPVALNSLLTTADPAVGLTATWTVNIAPLHGTVSGFPVTATTGSSVTPPGTLTYTPTPGYTGIDSFNIKASDGSANAFCTIIVTVNPSPAGITGTQCVVVGGATSQLSNTTAGGAWSTGNPGIATVSATGVVTGIAAGIANISYAPPGSICPAVATVTVNTLPAAIGGIANVCIGNTTALIEAGSGTWTSSNLSVGTISTSGVVSGLSGGTTNITYTLPSTCIAVTPVVVNIAPTAIIGTFSACAAGGSTTLSNGISGGTWTSGAATIATIGAGSGIVTGVTAGVANITYTAPTGCITSTAFTVNPLPAAISSAGSVCVGSTTAFSDPTGGGTWTSSNTAQASIGVGSGVATGITAGTPTIIYTLAGTGCKITAPLVVNPVPGAISGLNPICVGATETLTDGGGGTWTSSNLSSASINTFSGLVTGIGPGGTLITYTLGTGCSITSSLVVNPLPAAYTLTGGGSYCATGTGVHVGLTYAGSGVNYVLFNSGSPVSFPVGGSNSGLDFGLQTGTGAYTVVGTNPLTNCSSNMTGSVTVSVNPLPTAYNITGGGGFCAGTAGSPLGTDGSQLGMHYQLYNGTTPVGPAVNGTGTLLSFGSYTTAGTYTVVATNIVTGCTQLLGNLAIISATAAPAAYPVSGGGNYCFGTGGVHINLGSGSEAGTSYQLFRAGTPYPGGPTVSGGGPLDLGLVTLAGTYTVVATNLSGCIANMPGSATVIINPLPTVNNVTGGGGYCTGGAGQHVGLDFSIPGINYRLYYNGIDSVTMVGGSGSGLDFGIQTVAGVYTALAENSTTHCTSNMAGAAVITVNPLPNNTFNVTGSGSYCSGGVGRDISIDGSENGVNYQLYKGVTPVGLPIPGNISGLALDYGLFTAPGAYTIKGTNPLTGCNSMMTGSAVISVNPLPALHTVTGGGNYCDGGTGVPVGLNGSNLGIIYELIQSGSISNTISGTGSVLDFGLQMTSGGYTVVAMDSITGCIKNMLGGAIVGINAVPLLNNVTGGGSYCAGGAGFHIGLDGSTAGISYQLTNGTAPSGPAMSGSGSALDFGARTAGGSYLVTATNLLTGCTSLMTGSALINVNSLPGLQVLSGGGNYCAGGPGRNIDLITSDLDVTYQLYRFGVANGSPVPGAGGTISLGLDTFGVYTAKATDNFTGCTSNMLGAITIHTVTPAAYTVTGGGSYCAGGTGVTIIETGSAPGVSYQLVSGGFPVGFPVAGTGSTLSFINIMTPGTYSVQATDTTLGCVGTMFGTASVSINSLPLPQPVTGGGGAFCAGGSGTHIGLGGSVTGVQYQLYNAGIAVGGPVPGSTGFTLDFGLQTAAGTYTAAAITTGTGCTNLMSGSAVITIKPTPTPYGIGVENSGNYCAADAGSHIWLLNSQTGVEYQLFLGSVPQGLAVAGTGGVDTMGLEVVAGNYTIVGVNVASGCTSNMLGTATITIIPLPVVYSVTGGGGFCPGGAGVGVGLNGSNVGIAYQLYKDGVSFGGSALPGTGAAIGFGTQSDTGMYTVMANSLITNCPNTMFGNAHVFNEVMLTPVVTIQAYPATGVAVGEVDSVKVIVTNGGSTPTYQWSVNGHAIAGATNAVFINVGYFNNDVVTCSVTASGPCGGNTTSKSVMITLIGVGVKPVSATGAQISLVPNPNKGAFSLKGETGMSTDEDMTVEITNMLGQVIHTSHVKSVNGSMDALIQLSGNPASGMYILNLRSATEHTVFHFVVD
jgi:hypothetical protein